MSSLMFSGMVVRVSLGVGMIVVLIYCEILFILFFPLVCESLIL